MRVKKPSGQILFREVQQFRQAWLWVLLIVSSMFCILPSVMLVLTALAQKTPAPVWLIPVVVSLPLINMVCFYCTRLETIITTEGIYYRWAPWFGKYRMLAKTQIRSVEVVGYPYFKFGYHKRKGYGYVHNTGGNKGFRVTMIDDKMFYFGTQKINTITNLFDKDYAGQGQRIIH